MTVDIGDFDEEELGVIENALIMSRRVLSEHDRLVADRVIRKLEGCYP